MVPTPALADLDNDPEIQGPNPGLHTYMQLASIGAKHALPDEAIYEQPHPAIRDGQHVDPVLNLLMHQAHPVEGSTDPAAISDVIHKLATLGALKARDAGRQLSDDHTMKLDKTPEPLNLKPLSGGM